jgi:hypothetical protein
MSRVEIRPWGNSYKNKWLNKREHNFFGRCAISMNCEKECTSIKRSSLQKEFVDLLENLFIGWSSRANPMKLFTAVIYKFL